MPPNDPPPRSDEEQAQLDKHLRNSAALSQARQRRENGEAGKRERQVTFAELPLFASEKDIAIAVMGRGRYTEWRGIVQLLERRGFPKIDGLMGGRYTPAVRAFFDREYRVHGEAQVSEPRSESKVGAAHGMADIGAWNRDRDLRKRSRRPRAVAAPDPE